MVPFSDRLTYYYMYDVDCIRFQRRVLMHQCLLMYTVVVLVVQTLTHPLLYQNVQFCLGWKLYEAIVGICGVYSVDSGM